MPSYQLQVILYPTSNVEADAVSNSWSCDADDLTAAELFKDEILAFYVAVDGYLAGTVRQNNHVWKLYDRSDPQPRYPASEGTFNFPTAPAGAPAPPELAIVISFQALKTSGIPQARRRGRIYFGPNDITTIDGNGRPTSAATTFLAGAADDILTASNAAATWTWTVHSTVSGTDAPVNNGWVDDEFDIQRRRGRVPTSRTVFP